MVSRTFEGVSEPQRAHTQLAAGDTPANLVQDLNRADLDCDKDGQSMGVQDGLVQPEAKTGQRALHGRKQRWLGLERSGMVL